MQSSSSPSRSPTPSAPHVDKGLLTAWLLLLLNDGESYGWALLSALRERGVSVEPTLAYRTLRDLEREGAATSQWTESDAGPQRRSYRLTPKGRRTLAELAVQITASWHRDETFVRAHARGDAGHEPADREDVATDQPGGPARLAADSEHPAHAAPEPAGDAEASTRDSAPPAANRELIAAWLLLLLEGGASYGYGLRRALQKRHMNPDPARVYRILRELDRAGWVQSRWMRSEAGPPRRLYRVRAKGRRNRDELARVVSARRDSNAAFLRAYRHALP